MFRIALLLVCVGVLVPGALAVDRCSATEKGSLLIYPKVELRWNAEGYLIQDTFITLNNDWNAAVDIKMYFVSETCTNVNNIIELTKNEPTYWSVASGYPKGVSPWEVLGEAYSDPSGSGDLVMRGFVVAWAIDDTYAQMKWNHLYGGATIVNYAHGCAWEYNAYAFQVVDASVDHGDQVGTPGELKLDGSDYDYGFEILLLDFFASGATAFSGGGRLIMHDTDLTLLIADMDFRQDGDGPKTTKAWFEIWNAGEVGFSGMEFCFTKWNQELLSNIGSHFLVQFLLTDKGRARIHAEASDVCDPLVSENVVILGVAAKILTFGNGEVACSGTNLVGAGTRATTILYDVEDEPPPEKSIGGAGDSAGMFKGLQRR